MEIVIRQNQLKISEFQSTRIACGLEPLERTLVKRALTNSLLTLTAEWGSEVVGLLRVAGDGSFIFVLADVMVLPTYRNRGIASALLAHALNYIGALMPPGHAAMVSLIAAKGKEDLYRRAGFFETPCGSVPAQMVAFVRNSGNL